MAQSHPTKSPTAFKDLTGRKIGRWTVIVEADRKKGQKLLLCRCDCGVEKSIRGNDLRRGVTRSCGCLQRDILRATNTTHGASVRGKIKPEYEIWQAMLKRCENPNHSAFRHYGGRGITVCERWCSFVNFLKDMGPRPSSKHSIERRDNNGNYEPGNCYWATMGEQGNNRRSNLRLTYQGETLNMAQWAKRLNLHPGTLSYRLKHGKSPEEALTEPLRHKIVLQ